MNHQHRSESAGAVVPYVAIMLALIVLSGLLIRFITKRSDEEIPKPEIAKTQTEQKRSVPENQPKNEREQAKLPDITAAYEGKRYENLQDNAEKTAHREEPVLEEAASEPATEVATVTAPLTLILPCAGDVQNGYSDSLPVYNETMRDWRVHNAVDLSVLPGELATAAADGTVTKIEDDRLLGCTVTVAHFGGFETVYANLSDNLLVEEGSVVKAGDPIGEIGGTAVSEMAQKEHLHFALKKDGTFLDPMAYMKDAQEQ